MAKGLTDPKIRSAKPRNNQYKIYDSRGLFMIIAPSGGKWWRVKYRLDGKNKTLSLGTYPKVSLSEARGLRNDLREMVRQGIDPSVIRKAQRAERRQEKMEHDIRKVSDRRQSKNGGAVSVRFTMGSPIEIWKGGNVMLLSEDEASFLAKQLSAITEVKPCH
jgi:hypothetical protein